MDTNPSRSASRSLKKTPTGITGFDEITAGGLPKGRPALICGGAGCGKTLFSVEFLVHGARDFNEPGVFIAFEETPDQIVRNMRSVGIDLAPHVRRGLLKFQAARPTYHGLEMHLVSIHDAIKEFRPSVAVFDPLTNLIEVGSVREVKAMLTRLIDFMKLEQVTALFTSLTAGGHNLDQTEVGVSSLMDAWLIVRNLETDAERNRALYVLKARGLAHSNQVREFVISDKGLDLVDVCVSDGEVLIGSARLAREQRDQQEAMARNEQAELRRLHLQRHRKSIDAQIAALRADLDAKEKEARIELSAQQQRAD